MSRPLILSTSYDLDLVEIWSHVAQDDPTAARTLLETIIKQSNG